MSATTAIYALCESDTLEARYIGKANDPKKRLREHWKQSQKQRSHLGHWLKSLSAPPFLAVIEEVEVAEWQHRERYWIKQFKEAGYSLVNADNGGMGVLRWTPEMRAKLSVPKNAEWRRKISEGLRGHRNSPETVAKIVAANTGKRRSDKQKKAAGERSRQMWRNPEIRAKLIASHLRRAPPSAETLQKMREANLGKKASAETRQKLSDAGKRRIITAETRKKMGDAERGEKNHAAKLTEGDVRSIRERAARGGNHRILAEEFGVSRSIIGMIVNRKRWKHVA